MYVWKKNNFIFYILNTDHESYRNHYEFKNLKISTIMPEPLNNISENVTEDQADSVRLWYMLFLTFFYIHVY